MADPSAPRRPSPVAADREEPGPADPLARDVLGTSRPATSTPGRRAVRAWRGLLAFAKEVLIIAVMASALSFVIKTWVVQAFWIPSGSMENTLLPDDRVIVSKLTPGPFQLSRGDIVVFEDPGAPDNPWITEPPHAPRSGASEWLHEALTFIGVVPDDSENHLIKRVIGLPGDRVASTGSGPITVNGVPVVEPYVKSGDAPSTMAFDIVVPEGKVWVMGDNRGDSADSRYHPIGGDGTEGSVPIDKVTGRAVLVVWPPERWSVLTEPGEVFAKVPNPSSSSSSSSAG